VFRESDDGVYRGRYATDPGMKVRSDDRRYNDGDVEWFTTHTVTV
jgi:hypothetical protein